MYGYGYGGYGYNPWEGEPDDELDELDRDDQAYHGRQDRELTND